VDPKLIPPDTTLHSCIYLDPLASALGKPTSLVCSVEPSVVASAANGGIEPKANNPLIGKNVGFDNPLPTDPKRKRTSHFQLNLR
jgi:hypothetical protein